MKSFKVTSFRRIPLFPQDINLNTKKPINRYVVICDIQNLPTDFPTDTNPRDVKLTTALSKSIASSLETSEYFHLLNRGILLSAKHVRHDDKTGELLVDLGDNNPDDRQLYGVVDGGHTYAIIKKAIAPREEPLKNRYVSLEIFTGLDDDISIVDFAQSRNSSVAVDEKSLAELQGKFDEIIKTPLSSKKYANKIAYYQNAPEPVDIREVVALMTVFDVKTFNPLKEDSQPTLAYSQKEACLTRLLSDDKPTKETSYASRYKALSPILPEILELGDYIRYRIPTIWNEECKGRLGRKLEKRKGVEFHFKPELSKPNEETFDIEGKARPLWLPILAAMRVLVTYDENGSAKFITNPEKYFDSIGVRLVSKLKDISEKNSLNVIGKDKEVWGGLVQTCLLDALSQGLIQLDSF